MGEVAIAGFVDLDAAIIASFEQGGRHGWKHTEIDRWLWDGRDRKPAESIKAIERNHTEFERYGGVDFVSTPLQTAGGTQVVRAGVLNFGHALLYCALSEAPRAADVREALIRTFTKVTQGELSTAPRMEIRVLEVAAQQIVAPILAEQREFHTQVLTRMEQTDRRVITIESKLLGIERASLRFMDKPFTARTRRLHQQHVCSQYAGMCPCCRVVQIVKENAERLPTCNDEHYSGRAKNKLHQTWLTCADCNQRLLDLDYHGAKHQVFVNYQDSLRHFLSVELKKQTILF